MRILIIGGTGIISGATAREALAQGHEVFLLNRGKRPERLPEGARLIAADINDREAVRRGVGDLRFDTVADFIAFSSADIVRDHDLFADKTAQYLFVSSASAYQTPLADWRVSEGTPLSNPYWDYARGKIACEDQLMSYWRAEQFPFTTVRPAHTYDERFLPLGLCGWKGPWQVLERMRQGKETIIHGDGASLWTITHARDVARAIVGLMGNIHAIGQAVNVVGDETLTWNQLYQCIAAALGVRLNPFYVSSHFLAIAGDAGMRASLLGERAISAVVSNARLKQLVPGFASRIRFDQGIRETVQNLVRDPAEHIPDPKYDRWCDELVRTLTAAARQVRAAAPVEDDGV